MGRVIKYLGLIIALSALSSTTVWAESLIFIVNSENLLTEVSLSDIQDYYFKRKRQWPDGTSVRFIDRSMHSEVRKKFVTEYLKRSVEDLDLYWIGQKLYSGNSAPLKEDSDRMTIQFVSSFKGALGYVAAESNLSAREGVKVIKVLK